jgi:hypothetical protein
MAYDQGPIVAGTSARPSSIRHADTKTEGEHREEMDRVGGGGAARARRGRAHRRPCRVRQARRHPGRGHLHGLDDVEDQAERGGPRIEVEFEVDQNRNGVPWRVTLSQNGRTVARRTRVTRAPSGSFEARIVTPDRAGTDVLRGRAVSPSGEICSARATFS